jgi:hypothetical protein
MKSEKIVRLWRLMYIKIFEDREFDFGEETIVDKIGTWNCRRIFWRFYFCRLEV